jgi:hypothetical protein
MTFDDQTSTLYMKPKSTGIHLMKVRLTDEDGEFSEQ